MLIKPTINEFTGGLSKSAKELGSSSTSVANAIVETFNSVKDHTLKIWSNSYGISLTQQFAKNSEAMKKNLAQGGGIFSKSYARAKWAINGTLGRVWAGTKGLAQGTWRLPKQLLTHGVGIGVDLVVRGPVKKVGAITGGLIAATGELLTGNGKTIKKATDITRKRSNMEKVPQQPSGPQLPKEDPKVKPLNSQTSSAQDV